MNSNAVLKYQEVIILDRRNFLVDILFWILAFFFGYTVKKDCENYSVFKSDTKGSVFLEIYPSTLSGDNDFQKVQTAINKAIVENRAICFERMYDISGEGSLTIDKIGAGRRSLNFIGLGGGIKKTDAGNIFSSTNIDTGDISSSNMKFEGRTGKGTVVWDCDKLIRINSVNDSYVDIDSVVCARNRHSQTVKFICCNITGGAGWAFEWKRSFDTLIDGCTIEHREHGIRNTVMTGDPDNNTLRIINNVIEGLSGKAVELGSSFGVTIMGNYMEMNKGGYIDLSSSSNYHNGLSLIGNTFQLSETEIQNNIPAINLGKLGNNGVLSSGNVSTGVLYETTKAETHGFLTSIGDTSYNGKKVIGDPEILSELGRTNKVKNMVTNGRNSIHSFYNASTTFAAGELKEVSIETPNIGLSLNSSHLISSPFVASVSGNFEVTIHHYRPAMDRIIIKVENKSEDSQDIIIGVRIHQIK